MFQKRYDKVHQGTKNNKRYKMVKSRYTKVQLGTKRYKKVQKGTRKYTFWHRYQTIQSRLFGQNCIFSILWTCSEEYHLCYDGLNREVMKTFRLFIALGEKQLLLLLHDANTKYASRCWFLLHIPLMVLKFWGEEVLTFALASNACTVGMLTQWAKSQLIVALIEKQEKSARWRFVNSYQKWQKLQICQMYLNCHAEKFYLKNFNVDFWRENSNTYNLNLGF